MVYLKYIQGTNFSALILCGTDCGWELVCVRRLRGRAGEGMHLVTYNHRGGTTCTYSYCTWWHTITRAKIPDAPGWFMLSMSCCTLTPSSVVNPSLKNSTPPKKGLECNPENPIGQQPNNLWCFTFFDAFQWVQLKISPILSPNQSLRPWTT